MVARLIAIALAVLVAALAAADQAPLKPTTIRLEALPADTRLCAPPDEHDTVACVDVGIAIDRIRMNGPGDCPE